MAIWIRNIAQIGLPLLLFTGLAWEISQGLDYWSWDRSILLAIHQTSQPFLDRLAVFVTRLGTYGGVLPLTVLGIGILLFRQQWRGGFYLLTMMAGAAFLSWTLKLIFHRERPHFWDLFFPVPSNFSFPSGHTLFSTTFAIAIIVLAWNSRWRWGVVVAGASFAIAVAWSRLYLGVHYPSDILGGWLLAIAWATSVSGVFGLPNPRTDEESVTSLS